MTVLTLALTELRRLVATPLARVALVALMLVPVLYAGLYLWANRDPYAALSRVPAALVVEDEGASVGGALHNYGDQAAGTILAGRAFDWHRVSAEQAAAGLTDGSYDFTVTFPANFSASLASSQQAINGDGAPEQALIRLATDDTNGYLSSSIAAQATTTIRDAVVQEVGQEAADAFLVSFADIRSSLDEAVGGAGQLDQGAASALSGAQQLEAGTGELAQGAAQLADGTSQLAGGASRLADGTAQLADGAEQLAGGVARFQAAGDGLRADAHQLAQDLSTAQQELPARLAEAGLSPEQIARIMDALAPLAAQVPRAVAQVDSVTGAVDELSAGAAQLSASAGQAAAGAQSVSAGAAQSAAGAAQLSSGAASAHDGAAALSGGLGSLASGAGTLLDRLTAGRNALPELDPSQRSAIAQNMGDPVGVARTSITQAENYGAGLAPFFVSLAAWIGIYALFLIIRPVSRVALSTARAPVRTALAGWLTPAVLGAIQMLAVYAVLTLALQLPVAQPLPALGLMALASATFAAIILALNVWLGSVGQFLGLILMVVQLVTAGGTFPWQTLPEPLAVLHRALPMSSAVDGLRQLSYGGSSALAIDDALVLAAWLVGALAVTSVLTLRMSRRRTLRDLRPSLIGG